MNIKSELESISNELDIMADDESVRSIPKALEKLRDRVDAVLEDLENQGQAEEDPKKEGK